MAQKRLNGEGTIGKRSDGLWEAKVTIEGKRKSFYGRTRHEAKAKMDLAIQQSKDGEYIEDKRMSLSTWLDTWQETYLIQVKPSTAQRYESDIRLHIRPELGRYKLAELTPQIIQRFYNKLIREGMSPKSLKNVHGVLHKCLEKAFDLGYILSNPSCKCELPRVFKKEMCPLTDGSIPKFLEAIKGDMYADLYYFALFTGMRLGEVVGLTWDSIDFDRMQIKVYHQMQRDHTYHGTGKHRPNIYTLTTLKNGKSRIVSPAPQIFDLLRSVQAKQEANSQKVGLLWQNAGGFVFTNEIGGHLAPNTISNHFKSIVRKMGLPQTRFHDLRHTFATISLENGDDIKTVSEMLGHATTTFTMDIYGHVSDRMRKQSASRMEAYINSLE